MFLLLTQAQSIVFFALAPGFSESNVTGVSNVTHNYILHVHTQLHTCVYTHSSVNYRARNFSSLCAILLLAQTQSITLFALAPGFTDSNVTGVSDVIHNYR